MAKKFRFRLRKVLEYRKLVKDQRQKVLMEKNLRLRELDKQKERILQGLLAVSKDESQVGVALAGAYRERLRDELVEVELAFITAREEQEEALLRYQEAARDEEALMKLRDRKQAEHLEEILKEEEKFLDELGTQKGNNQYGD